MTIFINNLYLVPILAVILLLVNIMLSLYNTYQEKNSAFECGFHSFLAQNRTQIIIKFKTITSSFIILCLETFMVYPYSETYSELIIILLPSMVLGSIFTLRLGRQMTNLCEAESLGLEYYRLLEAIILHLVVYRFIILVSIILLASCFANSPVVVLFLLTSLFYPVLIAYILLWIILLVIHKIMICCYREILTKLKMTLASMILMVTILIMYRQIFMWYFGLNFEDIYDAIIIIFASNIFKNFVLPESYMMANSSDISVSTTNASNNIVNTPNTSGINNNPIDIPNNPDNTNCEDIISVSSESDTNNNIGSNNDNSPEISSAQTGTRTRAQTRAQTQTQAPVIPLSDLSNEDIEPLYENQPRMNSIFTRPTWREIPSSQSDEAVNTTPVAVSNANTNRNIITNNPNTNIKRLTGPIRNPLNLAAYRSVPYPVNAGSGMNIVSRPSFNYNPNSVISNNPGTGGYPSMFRSRDNTTNYLINQPASLPVGYTYNPTNTGSNVDNTAIGFVARLGKYIITDPQNTGTEGYKHNVPDMSQQPYANNLADAIEHIKGSRTTAVFSAELSEKLSEKDYAWYAKFYQDNKAGAYNHSPKGTNIMISLLKHLK